MKRHSQLGNDTRSPAPVTQAPTMPDGLSRATRALRLSALVGSVGAACLWPTATYAQSIEFFYTDQQNSGAAASPPSGQNWWLKGTATQVGTAVQFVFTTAATGNTSQFFNDFVFNVTGGPASLGLDSIQCTGNALADCSNVDGNAGDGNYIADGSAPLGNFISTTGWELTLLNAPPPGGAGNILNEVAIGQSGETIQFTVANFSLALLTTNESNGYFSCTHHQGLPNGPGSSRLCAKLQDNAPGDEVPGPLSIFGAATAFGYSRKLRRRLNVHSQGSIH
jgi:hypothetical protein